MSKQKKDPPPFNLTIFKSHKNVALTREFCVFLLTSQAVLTYYNWYVTFT
jgi:ABC-type molybdate transport system substrate-binding protein